MNRFIIQIMILIINEFAGKMLAKFNDSLTFIYICVALIHFYNPWLLYTSTLIELGIVLLANALLY